MYPTNLKIGMFWFCVGVFPTLGVGAALTQSWPTPFDVFTVSLVIGVFICIIWWTNKLGDEND